MTTANWNEQKEVLLDGLEGHKRNVTAQLLENQRKAVLNETTGAATSTASVVQMDKVFMPIARRVTPATIAMELVGVQPMTQPIGQATAIRVRYADGKVAGSGTESITANEEASGVSVYDKYSLLLNADTDYDARDAWVGHAGDANASMLGLESDLGNEMNLQIVKKTIEAKSRKLHATWTIESDQDAKAMHGIDIESELVAAVSDEIIRELDREVINDLNGLAGTTKTFDFTNADGRYAGEKFTALTIGMSDLSNQIATKSKRGGASWMVISTNVLTALRNSGNGSFVSATATNDISPSSTLFVGTFNGSIRVFLDLYATGDTVLMGYKGTGELNTGYVYCPYIPLMQSGVITDPDTMDLKVGLMSRYALAVFNNASTDLNTSADMYARATIQNLTLGF